MSIQGHDLKKHSLVGNQIGESQVGGESNSREIQLLWGYLTVGYAKGKILGEDTGITPTTKGPKRKVDAMTRQWRRNLHKFDQRSVAHCDFEKIDQVFRGVHAEIEKSNMSQSKKEAAFRSSQRLYDQIMSEPDEQMDTFSSSGSENSFCDDFTCDRSTIFGSTSREKSLSTSLRNSSLESIFSSSNRYSLNSHEGDPRSKENLEPITKPLKFDLNLLSLVLSTRDLEKVQKQKLDQESFYIGNNLEI